jgi:hypothetical protein
MQLGRSDMNVVVAAADDGFVIDVVVIASTTIEVGWTTSSILVLEVS